MPRQNQDHGSYVRGVTSVTPVNQGGTGAASAVEAVDNLNGLHRSTIDEASGIGMTVEDGFLKSEYFTLLNIFTGPRIKGPWILYRGCMARFRVTNFSSEREVQINIEGYDKEDLGYVTQGPFFAFQVPGEFPGEEIAIQVIYDGITRMIRLDVRDPSIDLAVIKTPAETTFTGEAWIEMEAPVFNGISTFDRYATALPGLFRDDTITVNELGAEVHEYAEYTGVRQISSDLPVSEIRIAGRLNAEDGYAYAEIDGVRYHLTTVFDEFIIKPKNSLKVDIFTLSGEAIHVAFIRPYGGNYASELLQHTELVIETSETIDGNWTEIASGYFYHVKDSLRFKLPSLPYGSRYIQAKYRYTIPGSIIESDFSDPVMINIVPSPATQGSSFTSPYIPSTNEFGKGIAYNKSEETPEIFVAGNILTTGAAVFMYNIVNGVPVFKDTLMQPDEPTRLPDQSFGDQIILSEDGRYLFVSAPTASFSDAAGTSGAVYVYERFMTRFMFVKRLIDDNRLFSGYGSSIASSGNLLLVSTGSSLTAAPSLYFYDIQDTSDAERFTLRRSESLGTAGLFNLLDIGLVRNFDHAIEQIPMVLYAAVKNQSTGVTALTKKCYLLNRSNLTMALASSVTSAVAVEPFDESLANDRLAITYSGYNGQLGEHAGFVHTLDSESRVITTVKWSLVVGTSVFTVKPDTEAVYTTNVPTYYYLSGGFCVDDDLSVMLAGSTAESLLVSNEFQNESFDNAGVFYLIRNNYVLG